ncbi:MAG TPA: sulfite reductase subunit alpha [Arenimonas sp.]|nr:sulfite reductase subunit alpha [Arenimonas sp.]
MKAAASERLALWGNGLAGLGLLALTLWLGGQQAQAWSAPSGEPARLLAAALLLLLYVAAVAVVWPRRSTQREAAAASPASALLVVQASQTGQAEQYAGRTAAQLREAGLAVREMPLAALTADVLAGAQRILFLVSTTGEGDAPDGAGAFLRRVMATELPLPDLRYGLLALGDSDYDNFCAFGRRLDHWLQHQGAQPLFDRVEVDDGDPGALRHWQQLLRQCVAGTELADWETPAYAPWTLVERRLLNPGSAGGPCFHLALVPPAGVALDWTAGDIAEIGPRRSARDEAPLPHREYSIASLPADGALHLLVRQVVHEDGRLGLCSGWLTKHAAIGERIDLRIRRNTGFHPPTDGRPLLLIGNGTGLAGLRALLKARIAAGHHRNWLLFGERNAAVDAFHGEELEAWQAAGQLERLDRVWSRDGGACRYVQHRLRECAAEVRAWVEQGAAIDVCGSLEGMAPGVHAVLVETLGEETLERLAEAGRYRRDVY